ncbi:hypothetical protein QTI33_27490 [Variovorax sp. J22P271]|uniref:hypothetical protein n=1 Tax=Variovorax davisae TaxID=3053515 RepID=UPI002576FD8D|nr:hypothetical protein [Variovorax sp. J22P271]MDM0035907.1 hypothetical protein [Variovorax sp. J22P271]
MNDMTAGTACAHAEKLRLNDAQWQRLQRLAGAKEEAAAGDAPGGSGRLRSNGLVATDGRGLEYLTVYGLLRLSQGR